MLSELASINTWDGNFRVSGLKRNAYIDKILPFLSSKLIKVITGQRRTGKSHLIRTLINYLIENAGVSCKNILYINMELRECMAFNSYEKLFALIDAFKNEMKPDKNWYLFIDEVQEIAEWEKALNSILMNPNENVEIFITGSNANLLASDLSTHIGGRYVSFEIFPFSFNEFLEIENKTKNLESFVHYMYHGGMPECFRLPDDETRCHYIKNLFDSIVFRDVIKRHNIRDVWMLEQLALLLADMIGGLFSQRKLLNTISSLGGKTNLETLGNYINFLKQAFYIHEATLYDIRGRKMIGGDRKYYLNDLSFKFYLSSSFDNTPGKFLENCLFLYLRRQGYDVHIGRIPSGEIDFIASKGKELMYIQVCYLLSDESVIEREFGNLEKINDNYPKFVVSLDPVSFGNRKGIEHVTAWNFVK